jgi:hypothetical protein
LEGNTIVMEGCTDGPGANVSPERLSADTLLSFLGRELNRFFCPRCLAKALAESLDDVRGRVTDYGSRGVLARTTARCVTCLRTQTVVRLRALPDAAPAVLDHTTGPRSSPIASQT